MRISRSYEVCTNWFYINLYKSATLLLLPSRSCESDDSMIAKNGKLTIKIFILYYMQGVIVPKWPIIFLKLTSCLKIERKPFTNFTLLGPYDGGSSDSQTSCQALTKEGLDSHSQSNRPPMAKSSLFRGAQTKYRDFIEINFYNEHNGWFSI